VARASLLIVMLLGSACARDACPAHISATIDQAGSSIVWGGDSPKVAASLKSIAVECFKGRATASGVTGASDPTYSLVITVRTSFLISDLGFMRSPAAQGAIQGKIIFEALTAKGVILGQDIGWYSVAMGVPSQTVSVTIPGLSSEAVSRVTDVQARWQFGK
jgi:hypothetical protein